MFGVKVTFIGPWTDSRLSALTPNIGLIYISCRLLSRRRRVGIHAAFDLRDALLVAEYHCRDRDRASDKESDNRNQQTAQACYRVD
jgi:hypothetical protein